MSDDDGDGGDAFVIHMILASRAETDVPLVS